MRSKSIVVLAAALLLVASVAPAVATDGSLSVALEQDDDGSATATVTHNGSAVENATVDVNATGENATYSGEGTHTTDENGTVDLPAPEENVTIELLAEYENETADTSAELTVAAENETAENETAESGTFGAQVSAYVHELLDGNDEQRRIGRLIAAWVVENNPGDAPDHAGPPGDDTGQTDGNVTAAGAPDNPGKGNGHGPPENPGSHGNGR